MDRTTTHFETMGTWAADDFQNLSGQPSSYTRTVPRKGGKRDYEGGPTPGTRQPRYERMGASYTPKAKLPGGTAPVQKRTYTVPNRAGRNGLGTFADPRQDNMRYAKSTGGKPTAGMKAGRAGVPRRRSK